ERLTGEQPELPQHRLLLESQRHRADRLSLIEMLLDAVQERDHLGLLLLLQSRTFLGALEPLGDRLEVGELELELEHVDVPDGIDPFLDVGDVGILECAHHQRGGIGFADVAEEPIAESLAAAPATHQPRDVREGDRRRDHLGRLEQRGEPIETRIRDRDDAGVRLDGRERVVADRGASLRHRVEERRFPGVRQPDDADTEAQILSSSNAACSARTASRTRGRSMMQVTWISLVAIIWMLMPASASAWKILA